MAAFLTFLMVIFIFLGVRELLTAKQRLLEGRLKQVTVKVQKTVSEETVRKRRGFEWLRNIITGFKPAQAPVKRLEEQLAQADILLRAEEFLAIVFCIMLLAAAFGFSVTHSITGGLGGLFFGFFIPNMVLRMSKGRRLKTFNSQLADALALMANTLRAGFGFLQAMDVIRKEMAPPISKEFGRALTEMNLGIASEEALTNLVNRVKSEDLDLVITAVIIQRQVGGNLASMLDSIAETIRERVRLQGEVKSLTAQGRISGMVIGFMPIALAGMLLLINRDYLYTMFTNKIGITMLCVAGIGELIGMLAIKKIVDIKI
ncbi:MAG: type II secretion system F family protein [Bacillota bacterium]